MHPINVNPVHSNPAHHGGHDIHAQCHKWMHYHVIAHGQNGQQFEAILDGMDDHGIVLMIPEEVDGEVLGVEWTRQPYGRRRFRRFRRQRFPFSFFAFPFFTPFPYFYPYYGGYPGYPGYGVF